jgi:hypothetical protein
MTSDVSGNSTGFFDSVTLPPPNPKVTPLRMTADLSF